MPSFNYSFTVRSPLAAVVAVHRDAHALKWLTPPPLIVQLHVVEPLAEGSIAEFTLWYGPLPVRWTERHSDVNPASGFTDNLVRGPMKRWAHTHRFCQVSDNVTRLIEHVDYEHFSGPRGILSRLLYHRVSLWLLFHYRNLLLAGCCVSDQIPQYPTAKCERRKRVILPPATGRITHRKNLQAKMSIEISPITAGHHASALALIVAAAPVSNENVSDWTKASAEASPDGYVRRDFVAEDSDDPGRAIGYAAIWPQREGRFMMYIVVDPDKRRQGIGNALLDRLLDELRLQQATIVQARATTERTESRSFLMHRSFVETNRMTHLRLDVPRASISALPALAARLRGDGVEVVTLGQEQNGTPDWLDKMLDLICAANPDRVSKPYGIGIDGRQTGRCTRDEAMRIWDSNIGHSPDMFFLAKQGDQYIGLSFLGHGDSPAEATQGDTAVRVEHRRSGVATLLKLSTIRIAKDNGIDTITTATANPAMLALNLKLGFVQDWVVVRLVRLL